MFMHSAYLFFFFFNDTATTEIYTLSLHDALPISGRASPPGGGWDGRDARPSESPWFPDSSTRSLRLDLDRKSTRLNSSHSQISYAVFCLKKKKNIKYTVHELDWIKCSFQWSSSAA